MEQVELYKAQKEITSIKERLYDEINNADSSSSYKDEIKSLITKIEIIDIKEKDIMFLKELINECYEKYPFLKEKQKNVF